MQVTVCLDFVARVWYSCIRKMHRWAQVPVGFLPQRGFGWCKKLTEFGKGEYSPEQQAERQGASRLCRVRTLQRVGVVVPFVRRTREGLLL